MVTTLSTWRSRVQIPSRVLKFVSAALASHDACKASAFGQCRFDSCPAHSIVRFWGEGLIVTYVRRKHGIVGATPTAPTWRSIHPPKLVALMVKRTSWLASNEQVQVRFLVGVLTIIPGVWRRHAALRRRRSCRFDSCQGYCGRTPVDWRTGCEPVRCGFNSHRPP